MNAQKACVSLHVSAPFTKFSHVVTLVSYSKLFKKSRTKCLIINTLGALLSETILKDIIFDFQNYSNPYVHAKIWFNQFLMYTSLSKLSSL